MSYDFIVNDNMNLFKAINEDYNINYDKPSWFTSSKEIGSYGTQYKYIYHVIIKSKIKLINITSPIFHIDLMNKILINVDDPHQRDLLLLPLGIPDIEYQKITINRLKELYLKVADNESIIKFLNNALQNLPILNTIKLFNDHHRFSLENVDTLLINFIRRMYPEYRGIISPINWPSCFHNNDFPMEICIFNPKEDCILQKKLKGGGKKKKTKSKEKDNFRFGCYNSNKFSNERIFFDESIMPVTDFKIVDPWKLHGDI
jgi:hypothetical protein